MDSRALVAVIGDRLGVAFESVIRQSQSGPIVVLTPAGVPTTHGFSIEIAVGWKSVSGRFIPGAFAADLLRAASTSNNEQRAAFRTLAAAFNANHGEAVTEINGGVVSSTDPSHWPDPPWRALQIRMRSGALTLNVGDQASDDATIAEWAVRFTALVLSIMPLEEEPLGDAPEHEGAETFAMVRRYERSRINRAACIALQGARCRVCSISFGERYGPLGEGYIHVHHLEMLSMLEGVPKPFDPGTDLVPICPNCHAMLHRRIPPYSPDEMRAYLRPARPSVIVGSSSIAADAGTEWGRDDHGDDPGDMPSAERRSKTSDPPSD